MSDVRVKICGLTVPAQAEAIAALGPYAIGLIFAESKRQVSVAQAAKIVAAAGGRVQTVGVFVDSPADVINNIVEQTGITRVQLHGDEPPGLLEEIAVPCWKVFRVRGAAFILEIHDWLVCLDAPAGPEAILLDAYSPSAAGGTGKAFNWNLLVGAQQRGEMAPLPPMILAGGLDATNVAQAIAATDPWAVDVSSGVESTPGVKDLAKVKAFLRVVREA